MEYKIKISSLAKKNIDNALEYYKNYSSASAKNFKKKLFNTYKILEINPFFIVKYRNARAIPLKKTPLFGFF